MIIVSSPDIPITSPLDALIAHFNSSSKSVQRAFIKLVTEHTNQESELKLKEKIERGEREIRAGHGISQLEGESTDAFMERLCSITNNHY